VLSIRQFDDNREHAKSADRLKEYSEDMWDSAMNGRITPEELTIESRRLQDAVFNNRRTSPLIFDWVYQRLVTRHEKEANKGADTLVEEAEKASR
jgi:SMODS-associating 4TM effector domain